VQVVLVGQPSLLATLRSRELTALWQRLAIRAEVGPLPLQEAADYLLHHLRVAGARPERLFADEALELLSRQTRGVPRLLNQAAHQALHLAAEAGAAQVDAEAALEALTLLGMEGEAETAITLPGLKGVSAEDEAEEERDEDSGNEESAAIEGEDGSCRLILASGRAE
jgi:hypothetical protein